MKTPLRYPYVEYAYIAHKIENGKFKTCEEVKKVLEFDILKIEGMSHLSNVKKEFAK